jgi:hypothetical protein
MEDNMSDYYSQLCNILEHKAETNTPHYLPLKTRIQPDGDLYYFDLHIAISLGDMYIAYCNECRFITTPRPLVSTVNNNPSITGGIFLHTYRKKHMLGKMFLTRDHLWTNTIIHECSHAADERTRRVLEVQKTNDYRESLAYATEIYTVLVRNFIKTNEISNLGIFRANRTIPEGY